MCRVITVKAPTRIDLAGGTLDIWPLSIIFAPAVCVNAAIDLYVTIKTEPLRTGGALIIDTGKAGKATKYPRKVTERKKNLFDRAVELLPVKGYRLTVDYMSPLGAGLGGSSALLIALLRTLCRLKRKKMSDRQIIGLAQNIEARHLGIPTGVQDYVAALKGGVNVIENGYHGLSVKKIQINPLEIEKRVVLAYSGKSRVSGHTNWLKIKNVIDGDKKSRLIFSEIAKNSLKLRDALEKGQFLKIGPLIDYENRLREKFGQGVVTAPMKKLFTKIRRVGGFPKICGAGGGGCFIVWCEPGLRTKIAATIEKGGMELLDYRISLPSAIK